MGGPHPGQYQGYKGHGPQPNEKYSVTKIKNPCI